MDGDKPPELPISDSEPEADLERLRSEYLDRVTQLLRDEPDRFLQLICHAVLQRPMLGVAEPLPFSPRLDHPSMAEVEERSRQRYAYIADLLLRRASGPFDLPDEEFVSLAQFIEHNVSFDRGFYGFAFHSTRPMDIWHQYFDNFEDPLSSAVALATHHVFQGLPVYQRLSDDVEFELLAQDSPLFHYLYLRGEGFEAVPSLQLPAWTKALYFKREHLRAHSIIFSSLDSDEPDEIEFRRKALRRQIGFPEHVANLGTVKKSPWPWGHHHTVHLGHLAAAADKWWSNFDSSDNTTAPTNEQVAQWLQGRGVGKAMAEKMATILRADGLPTGPRT